MKKLSVIVLCLLLQPAALAATEYLRFEGTIASNYIDLFNEIYDLDFVASQSIYFDYEIDTEITPDGSSDTFSLNIFQAILIGGTLGSNESITANSKRVLERYSTFLGLGNGLVLSRVVQCYGEDVPDACNFDLPLPAFEWQVGTVFSLTPDGVAPIDFFGALTLTYRGSEPPPPIPLPAAIWLMLGGLAGLKWFGRR